MSRFDPISLLRLSLLRHLMRHPWQLALAVLGIALGVAVVVAVDLANASARHSFEASVERVMGRATHRIIAVDGTVPDAFYRHLRIDQGMRDSAPVVSGWLPVTGGGQVQILGVDPFAEAPFRGLSDGFIARDGDRGGALAALLTRPDAALLPAGTGDALSVVSAHGERRLEAVGHLPDERFDGLVVVDIATAQALLGIDGLSHIDLILPDDAIGRTRAATLRAGLPPSLTLEPAARRGYATSAMSGAFALNLQAMSLLALAVGMLLIYNTMSFSVVQRRALLGMLRALGAERRQLFAALLGEALVLGTVGTLLGLLLGAALGRALVTLVTRTINDLYYRLPDSALQLDPLVLAKGLALGLGATLVAAWLPARDAADSPPGTVLSRARLEQRWRRSLPRLVAAGLGALGLSALVLTLLPGLGAGFVGLFLLLVGCALLTPPLLMLLVPPMRHLVPGSGLVGAMAARGVTRHLSRTGMAVAALSVAFATTIGVGVMVDSFRSGVTLWLGDMLSADLYLTTPAFAAGDRESTLDPAVVHALNQSPDIAALSRFRARRVLIGEGLGERPVVLLAAALPPAAQSGYHLIGGDPAHAWRRYTAGEGVMISEPLAYRLELTVGDRLTLPTPLGAQSVDIVGVFLDYASEHGRILLPMQRYQAWWRDQTVNSIGIYVESNQDPADLRRRLDRELPNDQPLALRSNHGIAAASLAIFERTFTITGVLRLLAIGVAFIGTLSALMALELERGREMAVLRALGMTPGQVAGLVALETGFMGLAAGLLAMPVGLALAAVLIEVINRRAFGWTLPYTLEPGLLVQALLFATLAALLAGLYPMLRLARSRPAQALRSE